MNHQCAICSFFMHLDVLLLQVLLSLFFLLNMLLFCNISLIAVTFQCNQFETKINVICQGTHPFKKEK